MTTTLRRSLPILATFLVTWVVMVELLNWWVIASGVAIAVVALLLTNRVLGVDYATVFLSPWSTLRYFLVMAREMTVAAWGMAWIIISGPPVVMEIEHVSELDDDVLLFLLANAIILTPGSLAVERDGKRITVLTAEADPDRARASVVRLERSIGRIRPPAATSEES